MKINIKSATVSADTRSRMAACDPKGLMADWSKVQPESVCVAAWERAAAIACAVASGAAEYPASAVEDSVGLLAEMQKAQKAFTKADAELMTFMAYQADRLGKRIHDRADADHRRKLEQLAGYADAPKAKAEPKPNAKAPAKANTTPKAKAPAKPEPKAKRVTNADIAAQLACIAEGIVNLSTKLDAIDNRVSALENKRKRTAAK